MPVAWISGQKAARLALLLNLIGTILIYLSFQATASDFRFVTTHQKMNSGPWVGRTMYALCVNNYAVVETDGNAGIGMGHFGCPDYENAKPAAIVVTEFPRIAGFGFVLSMIGFALQFFAVPTVPRDPTAVNRATDGAAALRRLRHEWDDPVMRMMAMCTLVIVACFVLFLPQI